MLIDRDAIEYRDGRWVATDRVVDIEIPRTLHGLLLARIDRLPDEARRVLRVAAVIGRTFPVSVLERVSRGSA
jgi:predicted ATPase